MCFEIYVEMKTKLTLSIDKEVVEKAKIYTGKMNRSLSDIVENFLKTLAGEVNPSSGVTERVKQLAGRFSLPEGKDYKEILTEELLKKYK